MKHKPVTAYQIYPKSFMDSNGDGMGDINGIRQGLDMLARLGIDTLWISPMYASPMADQGYDVSDYTALDPRFGTMEEFEALVKEAKERDIAVVMDFVLNHCSDEHEWFQKACQDPQGEYGQYFYIEKIEDGRMPNNWRSHFGGSVWSPLPGHPDLAYLHMFHAKQPDLNWNNEKVRNALADAMKFWMDKGIAGFRLDAVVNIAKPNVRMSFEPDRPDGLCGPDKVLVHAKGIEEPLSWLKAHVFAPTQAWTIGEVFAPSGHEMFAGEEGMFDCVFDFSGIMKGRSPLGWHASQACFSPEEVKDILFASYLHHPTVHFAPILENHDEPRSVSRYLLPVLRCEKGKKALALLNLMRPGVPFIYQGQEIGMENMPFEDISQVDDINTLDEYKTALESGLSASEALQATLPFSRDNARTPYQWDETEKAGFTKGTPWLAVNPNHTSINLMEQISRSDSLFHWHQNLVQIRKAHAGTFVSGSLAPVDTPENVIAYEIRGTETFLAAANFSNVPYKIDMHVWEPVLGSQSELHFLDSGLWRKK